jgi:glycine dehydrogenase
MKTDSFALRHLDQRENLPNMLETIGVETLDQLIYETIPTDIRLKNPLELEHIMTSTNMQTIRLLGRTNKVYKSYIGLGTTLPLYLQRFKEIFLKIQVGTLPHIKQR